MRGSGFILYLVFVKDLALTLKILVIVSLKPYYDHSLPI